MDNNSGNLHRFVEHAGRGTKAGVVMQRQICWGCEKLARKEVLEKFSKGFKGGLAISDSEHGFHMGRVNTGPTSQLSLNRGQLEGSHFKGASPSNICFNSSSKGSKTYKNLCREKQENAGV
jgi:hypothetical protein